MRQEVLDLGGLAGAPAGGGAPGGAGGVAPPPEVPLHQVTFCVLDLETTGGAAGSDHITEVGAVKVRGGEVLGEFATLVHAGAPVPPAVTALTGITAGMLAGAPPLRAVLPSLLEFMSGAALVAHNAPFDVSFLRAACRDLDRPWPAPVVVDTVRLARLLVRDGEVPNHKLATLARHFGASTVPVHRALDDARATVDVLHALIGRARGVATLADLAALGDSLPPRSAARRHLARDVPHGPGVYRFLDAAGRVLYVGSAGDLRARVRSYFTRAERRRRMGEMVALAARVAATPCPTLLEARVREVRLIASERPPYNVRSRRPDRTVWLVLTTEPVPRPALVRRPGARPPLAAFRGRADALAALEALHAVVRLRSCRDRLRRAGGRAACVLGQIGRCLAPCASGAAPAHEAEVEDTRAALTGDGRALASALAGHVARLAAAERFEAAATARDGAAALLRGVERVQHLVSLGRTGPLVAAVRDDAGGWQLARLSGARLAGTAVSPPGVHPGPTIALLDATADGDPDTPAPLDEADLLWRWLSTPGVRLVAAADGWWLPLGGAGGCLSRAAASRPPSAPAPTSPPPTP